MTKENGEMVTLGPYVYRPGRNHWSSPSDGTLTRGGFPVPLRVTEPVLRRFLDVMAELEAGFAERWGRSQGSLTYSRAE
ncbi:hypothetical protein KBY33_15985 [Streptomyces sp. RM99]|nr:hypothetical protein AUW26_24945 [Streptomyces sp. CC71]MBQ0879656.1 hypothetical protein [Streptomyces sp. RT42]MBQ0913182.1 hypothetical protein [Streptomyces sp. RM99]MBU8552438.1 hypothetical protein [Streptomyces sp. Osf17]MBU8559227.1 hypothetical protein [Streptomyces sp. Babs14]MBX4175058.1 hypothetical protein [Streptomyces geysiriensis]NEC70949.1 hypothetical protein [Streptomyces rochei]NUV93975.1 hypothetical protein [Streptomyces sp. KAI 90]QCB25092.1 hypothetical protein E5